MCIWHITYANAVDFISCGRNLKYFGSPSFCTGTEFKNANILAAGPEGIAEASLTEGPGCNCSSTLASCEAGSRILIPESTGLAGVFLLIDAAIGLVWLASGNHHKFQTRHR